VEGRAQPARRAEGTPSTPSNRPGCTSRRGALRRLAGLLGALPFAAAFGSLLERSRAGVPRRQVRVTPDFREGFAFADDVVVRAPDRAPLAAFSTRCTHLGCRISRVQDGLLVCSCHGSRFRADGTVASGPASEPLESLPVAVEPTTGTVVVDV
jgi:nitrite reductase/ring-hydroxylating ferredoxin subunit